MLFVTPIIASILTMVFLQLSFAVIQLRRKNKVGLGTGGHDELERAIRAQGNFAEYVPMALILLFLFEFNGAPLWLVSILGAALIIGRVMHAKGIKQPPPYFRDRIIGMRFTIGTLIALVFFNVTWLLAQFWL
jgi:uncharacterized membrane protein YecN with MAPEG domain